MEDAVLLPVEGHVVHERLEVQHLLREGPLGRLLAVGGGRPAVRNGFRALEGDRLR